MRTANVLVSVFAAVVGVAGGATPVVPRLPGAVVTEVADRPVPGTDRRIRVTLATTDLKYATVRSETRYRTDGAGREIVLGTRRMVADHIVVRVQDGVTEERLATFSLRFGGMVRKALRAKHFYLVSFSGITTQTVPDALARFRAAKHLVKYAEADVLGQLVDAVPDDPYFTGGHLWGHTRIQAPEAWAAHVGSTNTVVAVIDTGMEYDHPDLAANAWTNPGETGFDAFGINRATNGVDDDANGFVDDSRGWDFYNDDNDPRDGHSHGTRCAGHIGAVGDNGIGVVGVCWRVGIMPIKMWSDGGQTTLSDAIESFSYVAMMRTNGVNVRAVSVSWSMDGDDGESEGLMEVLRDCADAGILCTVSAGNDNANIDTVPTYPASYALSNLIVAASTSGSDTKSGSSNYGVTNVDLAAPGENIWSTTRNGTYAASSGTSRSAPYVAGVVALLSDLYPGKDMEAIRAAVLQGTDPIPALSGITVTGGRLNALGAFLQLEPLIRHTPLVNTTNTTFAYAVDADLLPVALLDTNSLSVVWERSGTTNGVSTNRLVQVSNALFRAHFTAQPLGTEIRYYLLAQNRNGVAAAAPHDAPAGKYTFRVVEPVSLVVTGTPVLAGTAIPGYGEHLFPSGVIVTAEADATSPAGDLARFASTGWSGTGGPPASGSSNACRFVIGTDSTLAWNWQLEYGLRQTSTVPGIVAATNWGAATCSVATVEAPSRAAIGGTNYHLAGWLVDGVRVPDVTNATPNPVDGIAMSASHHASAVYVMSGTNVDGDDLPDWWEHFFFGGTDAMPGEDADGDGYANLAELADSSNPRLAASTPVPPVIAHVPLDDPQVFSPPYEVSALITDNTGVAAATLSWHRVGESHSATGLSFSGGLYRARLPVPGGDGDTFAYAITAWDALGQARSNGPHAFSVRHPRLAFSQGDDARFSLGWESATGLSYGLFERPILAGTGTWRSLSGWSNVSGTGAGMSYTGMSSRAESRFYRLRVRRP